MVRGVPFTEEDIITVCENCLKLKKQVDFFKDELRKLPEKMGKTSEEKILNILDPETPEEEIPQVNSPNVWTMSADEMMEWVNFAAEGGVQ
ncbi:hypothetical protein [Methanobrevibacter sp.]|uniref:hypothetical protein n=1 Tax=Methanobrevibacter sp. TaxID=66852 RepID=UPI0026DEFFE7|nr:hypothetical protein [Methanobrevibacter sp.]